MTTNYVVEIATDTGGAATAYSLPVSGELLQVRYLPDATSPLDTGADITVTGDASGIAVLSMTNIGTVAFTRAPRQALHDVSGAAVTYDGTHPILGKIAFAGERIKVVVAQGGNTLKGRFEFTVDDD